MLLMKNLKSIL